MATAFTKAQVNASKAGREKNYDPTKKPGRSAIIVRQVRLDFDAIASTSGTALAASDTYQAIDVSAGETILNAWVNIITAATGAADIDLGFTGGDVDGLVDGVEANDTAMTVKAARGVLLPLYMTANDTVDVLEASGGASLAGCVADVGLLIFRPKASK
jgi:hypothetical protein